MNVDNLRKINMRRILPSEIKESLVCFTFVNSRVVDEAPDIATCNRNGYMYEIKKKKILTSLNLEGNFSSVSCYYLTERNKLVIFYLVFTTCNRLLIIRRTNKRLKVVKEYQKVREFQVYDFGWLGIPQIKINFLDKPESFICDFPTKRPVEQKFSALENSILNSFSEELEDLKKHIDVLTEEYSHLKKICFFKNVKDINNISISSLGFFLVFNNLTQSQLMVQGKWFKVFGTFLILGMTLCNVSNEIIDGVDVIINHKKIKDYTFGFFRSFSDVSRYLFTPRRFDGLVKPKEVIYAVGSFAVPEFHTESYLTLECFVASKNLNYCFVKETFEINVCDIALQTIATLEERFTVEDLLAILSTKLETYLKIQTEDLEDGLMESLLMKHLGFKLIKHVKDKLFYCTSTYLKEVFVALRHITKNPSVWSMAIYTSHQRQIYFLVNALYDLLPENSVIVCDERMN